VCHSDTCTDENVVGKVKMEDILNIFNTGERSNVSIIENDLDSVRSTVFGKFYEGIIAGYLVKQKKFEYLKKKPNVYFRDKNKYKKNVENIQSDDPFIVKLNESLVKEKRIHTNSDGLFKKGKKYYLWEAKNWPKWNEGKKLDKQVEDLLSSSTWLLAKSVYLSGTRISIDGIFFSWWDFRDEKKSYEKELKKLEKGVANLLSIKFKIFYTSQIISNCIKKNYEWYTDLINEQKINIDKFFKQLLGK
jgi:hypothetical protein